MWFRTLFDSLKPGRSRTSARQARHGNASRRPASCRLSVEVLEDRAVPAALSIGDVFVREFYHSAEVSVSLDAPSAKAVTVNYRTANGTARAGSDYGSVSGKLTFAPGETSKTILIPISGDYVTEGDETFFVKLKAANNATIADASAAVRILEPRVSVNNVSAPEGDLGTTPFTFTVTLLRVYDTEVRVNYATLDGFATVADNDYVPVSGTLIFAPGQTSQTFTVTVNGDTTDEGYEHFDVQLSATFADGVTLETWGSASILSDDDYGGGQPPGEDYGYGY